MKIISTLAVTIFFFSIGILGCGNNDQNSNKPSKTVNTVSSNSQEIGEEPELCWCLSEPVNTEWYLKTEDACRDIISKELGVDNWEKINFSQRPDMNRKWDLLKERCLGSKKPVKTGSKLIDDNSELTPEIGKSYGYIWESINKEAQVYSIIIFEGLIFHQSVYNMNGGSNLDDFILVGEVSGKWRAIDSRYAQGKSDEKNISMDWVFDEDYSTLTNNKGKIFKRVSLE